MGAFQRHWRKNISQSIGEWGRCLENSPNYKSYTLRAWYHNIFIHSRTISPQLEYNNAMKCSYENFPHTTFMLPCVENCQSVALICCCSSIAGSPETFENPEPSCHIFFSTFHDSPPNWRTMKHCNVFLKVVHAGDTYFVLVFRLNQAPTVTLTVWV